MSGETVHCWSLNDWIHSAHQVFTYKQSTITHQKVTAMHPMNEEGVDDMATLTELHGGSIMHNLYQRYKRNQIYVSSTWILCKNPSSPSEC